MPRREFTKKTQRLAWERSGGLCEAVGEWYGLRPGHRCNAPLSKGVQYDHIDLDANSKDNSLANCAAVCIPCHQTKTVTHDIPAAAWTQRQQDGARGVKKPVKRPISGPGFPLSAHAAKRMEREQIRLAPVQLFKSGQVTRPPTREDIRDVD